MYEKKRNEISVVIKRALDFGCQALMTGVDPLVLGKGKIDDKHKIKMPLDAAMLGSVQWCRRALEIKVLPTICSIF